MPNTSNLPDMKKILMISYYYPPLADVGGLRALAFSQYLSEFGWEPYVLSVKNPDKNLCIPGTGRSPDSVNTYYTWSLFNLSWIAGKANGILAKILQLVGVNLRYAVMRDLVCVPDEYIGWVPLTIVKGFSLIKKQNIDIIYVSCKPFSSAIIGTFLKSLTGKPLVLDFRDPVSPDHEPLFGRAYSRKMPTFRVTKWIEEKVLRQSDKLLLTTEETKDQYHSFFPFIKGRTEVIHNGFFEDYFHGTVQPFTKFTIVYSGNFYDYFLSPDPFFKALRELINDSPEQKDKIEVLFIGSDGVWLQTMIERYRLREVVRIVGRVSRSGSIEYIGKASLLLLRIVRGKISTKLFEGLAAGTPLLALINDGEVAGIISQYSSSTYYIVHPDDVTAIKTAIKDGYEKWLRGDLVRAKNRKFHENFNKKKLTKDFSSIINDVLLGKNCPSQLQNPDPIPK